MKENLAALKEKSRRLQQDMAKKTYLYRAMREDELDLPPRDQESSAISHEVMAGPGLLNAVIQAVAEGSKRTSKFLHFSWNFQYARNWLIRARSSRMEEDNYMVRVSVDDLRELAARSKAARSQVAPEVAMEGEPFVGSGDVIDLSESGLAHQFFGKYALEGWVQDSLPRIGIARGMKEVLVAFRGSIPRSLFERVDEDTGLYAGPLVAPEDETAISQEPPSQTLAERREEKVEEANRLEAKADSMAADVATAWQEVDSQSAVAEEARSEQADAAVDVALAAVAHSEAEVRLAATAETLAQLKASLAAFDLNSGVAVAQEECARLAADEQRLLEEKETKDQAYVQKLAYAIAMSERARKALQKATRLRVECESHILDSMRLKAKAMERLDEMEKRERQLKEQGAGFVDLNEDDDEEFAAILELSAEVREVEAVFGETVRDCAHAGCDIFGFRDVVGYQPIIGQFNGHKCCSEGGGGAVPATSQVRITVEGVAAWGKSVGY